MMIAVDDAVFRHAIFEDAEREAALEQADAPLSECPSYLLM
jgi:hypothetical protein